MTLSVQAGYLDEGRGPVEQPVPYGADAGVRGQPAPLPGTPDRPRAGA